MEMKNAVRRLATLEAAIQQMKPGSGRYSVYQQEIRSTRAHIRKLKAKEEHDKIKKGVEIKKQLLKSKKLERSNKHWSRGGAI